MGKHTTKLLLVVEDEYEICSQVEECNTQRLLIQLFGWWNQIIHMTEWVRRRIRKLIQKQQQKDRFGVVGSPLFDGLAVLVSGAGAGGEAAFSWEIWLVSVLSFFDAWRFSAAFSANARAIFARARAAIRSGVSLEFCHWTTQYWIQQRVNENQSAKSVFLVC